ncbi:MAG: hypothetical protein LH479_01250, partial [Polaromonas sp.]|nr:hypothetical protein [Polaromonas sp.]
MLGQARAQCSGFVAPAAVSPAPRQSPREVEHEALREHVAGVGRQPALQRLQTEHTGQLAEAGSALTDEPDATLMRHCPLRPGASSASDELAL